LNLQYKTIKKFQKFPLFFFSRKKKKITFPPQETFSYLMLILLLTKLMLIMLLLDYYCLSYLIFFVLLIKLLCTLSVLTHPKDSFFLFPYFPGQLFMKLIFLLPQANRRAYVDFGCTHPIDGLFWSLPIYLLGFFSKYECWVTDLIMPLCHLIFLGCHLPFCITRFRITMECRKNSYVNF
jgi:hypothetical protein